MVLFRGGLDKSRQLFLAKKITAVNSKNDHLQRLRCETMSITCAVTIYIYVCGGHLNSNVALYQWYCPDQSCFLIMS